MNSGLLFVPTILFLVIVAPIWIVMHYRYKGRMSQGISATEREDLELMLESIDKLVDRVETLESILNESHRDWRSAENASRSRSRKETEHAQTP